MNFKKLILPFVFFTLISVSGFCAEIHTFIDTSRTDVKNIEIGDKVFFDVQILHPKNTQSVLTEKNESENFAILNIQSRDIPKGEDRITDFNFTAAFFDTGKQKIPIQEFQIINENDTTFIYSDSLKIFIKSILTEKDTSGIKDIFSPLSLKLGFWDIFFPLLIIAIIVFAIIIFTRYKKGKPIIPIRKKKIEPAHLIALRKLDSLRLEKLLSRGKIKEYYVNISWICREYLENRFKLPILESTSFEIKQLLRNNEVEEDLQFVKILKKCDKVKYAKFLPSFSEADPLIENLENLIVKTKSDEMDKTDHEDNIS
ncbi:MAG: hypothetical protein U9P79_01375 [Candidatus Cloacimonadota bacterium]|nr:hypothetical protein [Candidatus Cloacimonadota bacterium]